MAKRAVVSDIRPPRHYAARLRAACAALAHRLRQSLRVDVRTKW